MSHFISVPIIHFTNRYQEACDLTDAGFEPIECAFGGYGSVLGPLAMDHHGEESHRSGVAIRACGEAFGACAAGPGYVVTGTPDADAVLAIVALSGLVARERIPQGFPDLVDRHDRDPIGMDLEAEPHGALLLAFNQTSLPIGMEGFREGVRRMCDLLINGLENIETEKILATDRARKRRAAEGLKGLYGPGGAVCDLAELEASISPAPGVALVCSTVWGFDVWYGWSSVVVSLSTRLEKITIGCRDMDTAEKLFGPGGLLNIYPRLGEGWGGREAVGGSPRGVKQDLVAAHDVARTLAEMLPTDTV